MIPLCVSGLGHSPCLFLYVATLSQPQRIVAALVSFAELLSWLHAAFLAASWLTDCFRPSHPHLRIVVLSLPCYFAASSLPVVSRAVRLRFSIRFCGRWRHRTAGSSQALRRITAALVGCRSISSVGVREHSPYSKLPDCPIVSGFFLPCPAHLTAGGLKTNV